MPVLLRQGQHRHGAAAVRDRLLRVGKIIAWLMFLSLCGAVCIYASTFVLPMQAAIYASHGLVGFLYGTLFMFGLTVGNVGVWIVTGVSVLDRTLWGGRP